MSTTHAEDQIYHWFSCISNSTGLRRKNNNQYNLQKWRPHCRILKTMAEMAKEKGMRVGIVSSSVSIDHATPACFYAHEDTRKNMYAIAEQMTTSGNFDYFGGGGACRR
jgi:alkaline phosphatase